MAFFDWYADIKLRLAPFRKRTDFECVKTVAVIDRLADRAYDVDSGADCKGRFGWTVGHNTENYMARAEKYLTALEDGIMPLKGQFAEPGMALVDHTFAEKDGKLHVFYNRAHIGYEWSERFVDTFGHAVSEDLVNWKVEPVCLTAEQGGPDCHQIWSPGIVCRDGVYYMYYTGVNRNVAQCICLATSTDLYDWKRYDQNPVVVPGKWYSWDASRWSDCRDSHVFTDEDGTAYMYYCTAVDGEGGKTRTAMGTASSRDMLHWEDRGCFSLQDCPLSPESPFVIQHEGKYYLFYTRVGSGTAYAVSDDPLTGWRDMGVIMAKDPADGPRTPANVPSCSEVFTFKGQWYISCAERQPGCEQYLEIFRFRWNSDGTVTVGERVE